MQENKIIVYELFLYMWSKLIHISSLTMFQIEFVEQLPKTVSGKIRRVELRNTEWGRDNEE